MAFALLLNLPLAVLLVLVWIGGLYGEWAKPAMVAYAAGLIAFVGGMTVVTAHLGPLATAFLGLGVLLIAWLAHFLGDGQGLVTAAIGLLAVLGLRWLLPAVEDAASPLSILPLLVLAIMLVSLGVAAGLLGRS